MKSLKKLFGKKAKKPNLNEAIVAVKSIQEMLTKKQNFLEQEIKKETDNARKHAVCDKKAARDALKRKKRYEHQLQQLDGQLTNLEAKLDILTEANINFLAVAAMKKSSKALKATQKETDLDELDQILDSLEEQRKIADDISNALSQPNTDFDDSELDELELEELSEDFIAAMPQVPQHKVKAEEKQIVAS